MTARDVEFSLKRVAKLTLASETQVTLDTKKTKALDERTIQICSKQRNDFFLYTFTYPHTSIVSSKHVYEDKIGFKSKLPVLAGPYKMNDYGKTALKLRRHETHPFIVANAKAPEDVTLFYQKEAVPIGFSPFYERMKRGITNFLVDVSAKFGDQLTASEKKQFHFQNVEPNFLVFYYLNNVAHSRLKEKKNRNALTAVIQSCKADIEGKALVKRAYQFFPPGFLGHQKDIKQLQLSAFEETFEALRKNPIILTLAEDVTLKGKNDARHAYRVALIAHALKYGFEIKTVYLTDKEFDKQLKSQKGFDLMGYNLPFAAGDPTSVFQMDFNEEYLPVFDPKGKLTKMIRTTRDLPTKMQRIRLAQKIGKYLTEESLIIPRYYAATAFWSSGDFDLSGINLKSGGINFWELRTK